MRTVLKYCVLTIFTAILTADAQAQTPTSTPSHMPAADFQKRVSAYSKLRGGLAKRSPKLPAKTTAEQIEAHKLVLQKSLIAARVSSRLGDVITPNTAKAIRTLISRTYATPAQRAELRKSVMEAENKTVPVRVNSPYPEASEMLEMPPKLLLALPQLPKELRWRFVADKLLLMDKDLLLIVDYMTNVLP